jgi:ribonuclease HI
MTDKKSKVVIYTDGSCLPNPGSGGWGALLMYKDKEKEIYGSKSYTTNNEMELWAALESLQLLTRPCDVTLFSDSRYLVEGITKWYPNWIKKNKSGYANENLWHKLAEAATKHSVKWIWVRSHNGDTNNEKADRLANLGRVLALRK